MKNIPLLTIAISFFIMLSSHSYSLGFGDMTVQSHLGEPFLATLQLLHSEDLSADQIRIQQANSVVYKQLGIERKHIYSTLKFSRNKNLVTITTTKPIAEPYLNFVLKVKWPNGQLIKTFEILIDPAK